MRAIRLVLTLAVGLGIGIALAAPPAAQASCAGICGGWDESGNCYCDELCHTWNDCCPDKCTYCPSGLCPGGGTTTTTTTSPPVTTTTQPAGGCELTECWDYYEGSQVSCDPCANTITICYGYVGPYFQQCPCPVCGPTSYNDAQFVSQSVSNPMNSGQTASVTVEMKNTGTTTWPAYGSFYLGSQNPQDNIIWGLNRVQVTVEVPPGNTFAFSFEVKAPTVTQNQNRAFQWRMLQQGVQWFGAFTPTLQVLVQPWTQPPPDTLSNSYICPGYPDRCVGMCGDGCQGIWVGGSVGYVQKWTCECLKHDLVPRWCSKPGPNLPGCQNTYLYNPAIPDNPATPGPDCYNPQNPNAPCDAERSFLSKPDLGEAGLSVCDLTHDPVGNYSPYLSPVDFCSTTGPDTLLPLRPPTATPGAGETWLGSTTLITQYISPRWHPRYGWYDASTAGTLMTFPGTGRAVIGIAGKASGNYIFRVGPDSLLCTDSHFDPPACYNYLYDDGDGGTKNICGKRVCSAADGNPKIEALDHLYFDHNYDASGIKQVVMRHKVGGLPASNDPWCGSSGNIGHSFKWCFVNGISPGTYISGAKSVSKVVGLVDGHMTADTYWFGPAASNCPPVCTGKPCGASDGCTGTCCSGSGCTPASCGTCKQLNACGSGCVNSPSGTFCTPPSGGSGTCNGQGTCVGSPNPTTTTTIPGGNSCSGRCGNYDPSLTCQCDEACAYYGDCCGDKCFLCGGACP